MLEKLIEIVYLKKINIYEANVEKLRTLLNEFEKGTVPMIRVETDYELIARARDYINRFKGKGTLFVNAQLIPPIERLVSDLQNSQRTIWYTIIKKEINLKANK
jgi:hypothetical protein